MIVGLRRNRKRLRTKQPQPSFFDNHAAYSQEKMGFVFLLFLVNLTFNLGFRVKRDARKHLNEMWNSPLAALLYNAYCFAPQSHLMLKQKQNHIRCFPAAAAEDQLNDNWLIHWLVHQANSPLAKSEIKQRRQASLLLLHKLGYSIYHVFCQFCQCHLMQAQQPSATWLNTHCCFLGNDTVILTYLKITHVDQILPHFWQLFTLITFI